MTGAERWEEPAGRCGLLLTRDTLCPPSVDEACLCMHECLEPPTWKAHGLLGLFRAALFQYSRDTAKNRG
jgi:hypothetical protein